MGAVAGDGADVDAVLKITQGVLVQIHHRDFIGLFADSW